MVAPKIVTKQIGHDDARIPVWLSAITGVLNIGVMLFFSIADSMCQSTNLIFLFRRGDKALESQLTSILTFLSGDLFKAATEKACATSTHQEFQGSAGTL